jgi:flavin-dependent thymidylate synthase
MEPDGTFDELIYDHKYTVGARVGCDYRYDLGGTQICGQEASKHADPRGGEAQHLINTHPHPYVPHYGSGDHCAFSPEPGYEGPVCGYPEAAHQTRRSTASVVRMADVAQYARPPMPDEARGRIAVTLIDAPVDPLGTLAVLCGIYEGRVARSKAEVTDDARRAAWEAMQATVLSGPLEAMQFTFLVEGVTRSITHQMVRNRFAFFAQESLRFAVADDWAQEVPLPPSLAGLADDDPRVTIWRKQMNATEDAYGALVGAGMPAEEARGVLPHDIPTRLYVTWSMRSILQEAGKRTCTQAQFPWRTIFGGIAAAFRAHGTGASTVRRPGQPDEHRSGDAWQYKLFADAIRPVCYQTGSCGFMAKFDRGCTIRARVDANADVGRPSSEWGTEYDVVEGNPTVSGVGPQSVVRTERGVPVFIGRIDPREWAADPGAARVQDA